MDKSASNYDAGNRNELRALVEVDLSAVRSRSWADPLPRGRPQQEDFGPIGVSSSQVALCARGPGLTLCRAAGLSRRTLDRSAQRHCHDR